MKTLVSYSNCQGGAVLHFLKKLAFSQEFKMEQWNNWQLVLGEQNGKEFIEALKRADVLLYQPTGEFDCTDGSKMPSSDALIFAHVKPECVRISWPYIFNHGFFPVLKVAPGREGFVTGRSVKELLRQNRLSPSDDEAGRLDYGCALRFAECLAEQSRREETCDIKMADFILANFQKRRLFLTQNHPTSAVLAELAERIRQRLAPYPPINVFAACDFPENEANLPGTLPVHPAVVKELGLAYGPDSDFSYYRKLLEEMITNPDK